MESIQAEDESAKLCKRRIEHLKEHSSDQPAAAGLWKRKRMDRMMVEHLLRCGYYNTAVKLARQSGIEVGGARRGLAGSGQRGRAWRGVPGLHARVLMSRVCKGLPETLTSVSHPKESFRLSRPARSVRSTEAGATGATPPPHNPT